MLRWDYVYENGSEKEVLLTTGIFEKNISDEVNSFPSNQADWDPPESWPVSFSTGYECGRFTGQEVSLFPGRQKLVIYVQNPGGRRTSYKINNRHPDITYTLPEVLQKIEITNVINVEDASGEYNGIPISKKITLFVNETDESPYEFRTDYTIRGIVRSLTSLESLIIKSSDEALYFDNNALETTVNVDSSNRFSFPVFIHLPEKCESGTYYINLIPSAPCMSDLKTAVCVEAKKIFKDTHIVPDFTLMDTADNTENPWLPEERASLKKAIRIQFHRFIPGGSVISLILNYEYANRIRGTLEEIIPGNGIYKVTSESGQMLLAEEYGLKYGNNRIQWIVYYDGEQVSSSLTGKQGMNDFIFHLEPVEDMVETVVSFPVTSDVYYNSENDSENRLPDLIISKDPNTTMTITVNNEVFKEPDELSADESIDLTLAHVIEGHNTLEVFFQEKNGTSDTLVFLFWYDDQAPLVEIESFTYDDEYEKLKTLTAIITEANLAKATLMYGDIQIDVPPVFMYIGGNRFTATWDSLDTYSYIDIIPSPENPVYVTARDHASRTGESDTLEGISPGARPDVQNPVFIDLSALYYHVPGTPRFLYNEPDTAFPEHAKFYSSSIDLEDYELTGGLNIERHTAVAAGNNFIVNSPGEELALRADDRIQLKPGFRLYRGSSLSAAPQSFADLPHVTVPHNEETDSMTFIFWFRYEEEGFYRELSTIKRILTVYEDPSCSVYLAYNHNREIALCVWDIPGNKISYTSPLNFAHEPDHSWQLIGVGIDYTDPENPAFHVSLNDLYPRIIPADFEIPVDFSSILSSGATYYFGSLDQAEAGHFSIADPFYINQLIGLNEILSLKESLPETTQRLLEEKKGYVFDFSQEGYNVGDEYYQLRTTGEYFTNLENSVYTEPPACGSLVASDKHRNILDNDNNNKIVFDNDDHPVTINCIIDSDETDELNNTLTIEPQDNTVPGKYYFGDTFLNHGLKPDCFYSIALTVEPEFDPAGQPVPPDARLVYIINNRQQERELQPGFNHFIYEHDNTTPQSVIMYIETGSKIIIRRDMVFNEGNFIVPFDGKEELDRSCAGTRFLFRSSGTFSLWYKPFTINEQGFSNYESTLIDSEFITIRTRKDSQNKKHSISRFSVTLTGGSDNVITLDSHAPVRSGWQHLQVNYRLSGEDSVAYLYVNGECAAKKEGFSVDLTPTMTGIPPAADNVIIGANFERDEYAEGFIDDVIFSGTFMESLYEPRDPIQYSYTEPQVPGSQGTTPELIIEQRPEYGDLSVENINLALKSREGDVLFEKAPESLSEPYHIDLSTIDPVPPAGIYRLYSKMIINGHRYCTIFNFLKNDRPVFTIRSKTPMIIYNKPSDIRFVLEYDDSFLQTGDRAFYAGFTLQLRYIDPSEGTTVSSTLYVCQDFPDQEPANWIYRFESDPAGEWNDVTTVDNLLPFVFHNIISTDRIEWELKSFYFQDDLDTNNQDPGNPYAFDNIMEEQSGYIYDTRLTVTPVKTEKGEEYKLHIEIGSHEAQAGGDSSMLDELSLQYKIIPDPETGEQSYAHNVHLNGRRVLDLFYDDILFHSGRQLYGSHECIVSLIHNEQTYYSESVSLEWRRKVDVITVEDEKYLNLIDFSLLSINKNNNGEDEARLYMEFDQSALTELHYSLSVFSGNQYETPYTYSNAIPDIAKEYHIVTVNIFKGVSNVKLELYDNRETGFVRTGFLEIKNIATAPEVAFTNSVPTLVSYNNIYFSWKGFHDGVFKEDIEYAYNFNGSGYSTWDASWRDLELYNLEEGYHNLKVKARYDGEESIEISATFFVDVCKPRFNPERIHIIDVYDETGIKYAVHIIGDPGAITDASLAQLMINGENVKTGENGSFTINTQELIIDGDNNFVLTAVDEVNNYTDYIITIENTITSILYPTPDMNVAYAPVTLVGSINGNISEIADIYVFDITCEDRGIDDFSGWKRATVNQDRMFFVENIFINPGTVEREACTPLYILTRFRSGRWFIKQVTVWAGAVPRLPGNPG